MNDIWNPWHGCKKYSEGCENCYMYFLDSQRDKDGSKIYKVKTEKMKADTKKNIGNKVKTAFATLLGIVIIIFTKKK